MRNLDGDRTVYEEVADGEDEVNLGAETISTRQFVAEFNFKGTDQNKKVKTLSGGERNRLHIAKGTRCPDHSTEERSQRTGT